MIAIHTKTGDFAAEWVRYCQEKSLSYKEVDCFSSDIIDQLSSYKALLWHWAHHDYHAILFARQLVASAERMGLIVFPNTATAWHYDDKVGQKYLLEAIEAPLIPSHVFYDKNLALKWVEEAKFPKVWKLRGGAGSQNVRLVRSKEAARRIVNRSFDAGWSNSRLHALQERFWQLRRDRNLASFINIWRGIARVIVPHEKNVRSVLQRDYVYFQDFVPDNDFDIRVIVIGNRAFAIKRMVRDGDFRASGSGSIIYDPDQIPKDCIRIAFDVAYALRSQSCAFDFVRHGNSWFIVEISYAFSANAYRQCPGYWDESRQWHAETVTPEHFMLDDLLKKNQFRRHW